MKADGGYLISQIHKIGGRIFNELLRESGVEEFNGPQGRILYSLWDDKILTIKEISKKTGLAKTSLTSMLKRMENSKLIEKVENNDDRRSTKIKLTNKAKTLKDKYENVSNKIGKIYYKGFNEDEIINFENYLKRILNNLEGKDE